MPMRCALIRIVTSNQAAQIEAAQQLLKAFARLPQTHTKDAAACSAFLADMLAAYPSYLNIALADPDGNVWCSALPLRQAINVADRMYFTAARDTRRFAVGEYQTGRITQQPAINYGYPVLSPSGEVEGVVYLVQGLNWLTSALSNVEFPLSAIFAVTDRNGTVLARKPDVGDWMGKAMPEQYVLSLAATQEGGGVFEADDAQGVGRLWAHAPLIAGHESQHDHREHRNRLAFAEINRRLARNLVGLGLVTLVALFAALAGGKYILRRVKALVAATAKLASGDLGTRVPPFGSNRSELDLLAGSFNAMATTLQERDLELRVAEEKTRKAEVELAVTRAHMDIARQIQRSLLPEDPLAVGCVRYAGRCIPADSVGGDYFGYFPRDADGVDTLVGDVSGHGVGAALLMAEARTMFLAERLVAPSASQLLCKLNELLHADLDRAGYFITACCAIFDAPTRELSYASAGHPPALLLRAGETRCTTLDAGGCLLGIDKSCRLHRCQGETAHGRHRRVLYRRHHRGVRTKMARCSASSVSARRSR